MKVRRIFLHSHRSSMNVSDNSTRLAVYFREKDGNYYVWTPTWNKGTKQLFSQANLISGVDQQQGVNIKLYEKTTESPLAEEEESSERTDFKLLATQLGSALGNKVTYQKVDKAAKAVFNFESKTYEDSGMAYITSQNIYDWVMTLAEQPVGNERKIKLLKKFIGAIAPENSPLAKLRLE